MEREKLALPNIPPEREDDLHHLEWANSADLILFMAGNQFMVMEELIGAFRRESPETEKIFYETLPPGLELKQILAGGAIFRDQVIDAVPDIYASVSEKAIDRLEAAGWVEKKHCRLYLHNRLVLMVPAGNPLGIKRVDDLARPEVRISQPNPENEDIADHILGMYRQTGGEAFVARIMEEKKAEGTTLMTTVHHRETPERILSGKADVGPVWATEVVHAQRSGLSVEAVEPGENLDQRHRINYYVCRLMKAPHPAAAERFLDFIVSRPARMIFADHGFVPPKTPL
jgi:molybdate transport system substrate-binding protein